jgi:hypothetical protein
MGKQLFQRWLMGLSGSQSVQGKAIRAVLPAKAKVAAGGPVQPQFRQLAPVLHGPQSVLAQTMPVES